MADDTKVASATSFLDNPPEIYTNSDGVRFRLVGPAHVGLAPRGGVRAPDQTDDESARPAATPTVTELAERLRPVMLMGGRWEYVGEEPAYDLAESILRNEVIEQPPVREGRVILGDTCGAGTGPCDDRTHFTGATTSSAGFRPTLFIEYGCSGTMIGRSTAVTAAHCMYDTTSNFWYVVDGTSCDNTGESSSNNTEDRRPVPAGGTANTQNCLPRMAAGMNSDGAPLGWLNCYNVTINTAFRNGSGIDTASAQNDFAIIDFNTDFCSNDFPGDTTGWRGTWIATAADFDANSAFILGYPNQSSPGNPDNSGGGASGFPIRFSPTDCGSLSMNDGNAADSFPPCTSAMQVGMTGEGGSLWIDPLGNGTWQIGTTTLDTSAGQSGSGYVLIGDPTTNRTLPSTANNEFVVGIHRGGGGGGWNVAHAWDMTVRNFVATNSDDL